MISYTDYDHAEWLESEARATQEAIARRLAEKPPKKPRKPPELGWETLRLPLSDHHRRVAHILGLTFGGIYNAPVQWDRVDWRFGYGVSVPILGNGSLATFDFARLTAFVFLCHEARVRGEVDPNGPRGLRLAMWPRKSAGRIAERHPNLAEAVADFYGSLPANHAVIYRPPAFELTAPERDAARHALGLGKGLTRSYRNYFVAGQGHADYPTWIAMVAKGAATRQDGTKLDFGGDDIFSLTRAGAEAALLLGESLDPEDFPA